MIARQTRVQLHPIAVLALPVVAILAVLFADTVWLALLCITVAVTVSFARGPGFALGVLGVAAGGFALIWFGFSLSLPSPELAVGGRIAWLPFQPTPEQAFIPLRGALRMTTVVVLYVVTAAFVRGQILGDTLIAGFGIPYRVIDVLGLGTRFAALIRRDALATRSLARLRSRGRPLRALRLLAGLTVPVLMASFRHADELSIAMEARGFGTLPERTVHHAVRLRWRDGVVVAAVWAATVLAAIILA